MSSHASHAAIHTRRSITARATRVTLAASLALSSISLALPVATAGPDDGRMVATRAHIDTPKTFWENGTFNLHAEAPRNGIPEQNYDRNKSVLYVGKGYSGYKDQSQQYIFTVPNNPVASFLGKPGDHLYAAPSLPLGNHDPAWIGFGADTNIPTEQFRDGNFALDMLDVKGPGNIEMFSYKGDDRPDSFSTRFFSSSDIGHHSMSLNAGSHTHNYTTFTKPGRYEITYRTVARSKDGTKTIESKPTTVVWQVGGQQPIDGEGQFNPNDTIDRYNAAPNADPANAGYELSLEPKKEKVKDGDNLLHTISFNAKEKINGKVTLFNNGYFLTDLDVKDGHASWDEMLGNEASNVQAVFTPEGPQGARWISNPLPFIPGDTQKHTVTSAEGNAQWPQEVPDPDNTKLSTELYTPNSDAFTATVTPSEYPGYNKLTVKFKDPKFRGEVHAGLYETATDANPWRPLNTSLSNGESTYYFEAHDWLNGTSLVVNVMPHPDMNANRSSITITEDYKTGQTYSAAGQIKLEDGSPAPVEPTTSAPTNAAPAPSTSAPAETAPAPSTEPSTAPSSATPAPQPSDNTQPTAPAHYPKNQCVASPFAGKKILNNGHVDLKATLKDGKLTMALKDETGQIDKGTTNRNLNDVVFTLSNQAKFYRNSRLMDPALDFIGSQGAPFYGVPQTQIEGIIWPGYNTQEIDYSKIDGNVQLHIEPSMMPDKARFGMYIDSSMGKPQVLLDSTTGKDTIDISYATHVHENWIFSEPGNYAFKAYYTAKLKDGTTVKTDAQQISFAVGNQAVADCSSAVEPGTAETPGGSEQPINSAQPVNAPSAGSADTSAPSTNGDASSSSSATLAGGAGTTSGESNDPGTDNVAGVSASQAEGAGSGTSDVTASTSNSGAEDTTSSNGETVNVVPGVAPAAGGSTGNVSADQKCYPTEEVVETAPTGKLKTRQNPRPSNPLFLRQSSPRS